MREDGLFQPASLTATTAHEWRQLSSQVLRSRAQATCAHTNVTLGAAAEREPDSPATPAYRLWIADNHARDGNHAEAIRAYDETLESTAAAPPLIVGVDVAQCALLHKAQSASLAGNVELAIASYRDLANRTPRDAAPLFQAGQLAERNGDLGLAAQLYKKAAAKTASSRADDSAELARRALIRLEIPSSAFARDPHDLAKRLAEALEEQDVARLQALIGKTHFAVGPMGGHFIFESEDLLEELYRDLAESRISARSELLGEGGKRYLHTSGWRGRWYRGDVLFMMGLAPRGWQWTGIILGAPNELWAARWEPDVKATNDPLPFELLAPWPADQCFAAGGLSAYAKQLLAVAAAGPFGAVVAFGFSTSHCGFGPRGIYYNSVISHNGRDAFAIDFTRYSQYLPHIPENAGTPVLAARSGVVTRKVDTFAHGDSSGPNLVEIEHADPGNPADTGRFTSRYLHLSGPYLVRVSQMMWVKTGQLLGYIDDTGDSAFDHLHFSIHDKQIPFANTPLGASVRPTPMSGVTLGDDDTGKCVCSNNIMINGDEMIDVTEFAGQNWVITPTATAVGQTPPRQVQDQLFLLVLSGVAMVGLKGKTSSQWLRETVSIRPDLNGPLQFAINKHGIPVPAGNPSVRFRVEQWAPFASLGAVYNAGNSVNSGFAVDAWRPNPFDTGANAASSGTLDNLFQGIQVDVAVRDSDAFLYRVGYNITLLGRIVFTKVFITRGSPRPSRKPKAGKLGKPGATRL